MRKRLEEIPRGEVVFIDSNILIYHFCGLSRECCRFLRRCASGELCGVTSTVILLEICHRLMCMEASQRVGARGDMVRFLRRNPQVVKGLEVYRGNIRRAISDMGLEVVGVWEGDVLRALEVQERYGLLTNDSLNVALMEREGIRSIATGDPDFEVVEGIKVWMPGDIRGTSSP